MNLFQDISSRNIKKFHDECHQSEQWPDESPINNEQNPIWNWIEKNHKNNCQLWYEEDKARRVDVPDSAIAQNKRNIDSFNQARNDAIEKIDEYILHRLANTAIQEGAWLNSETAGSIIDRLSIVSLKILNMGIQSKRGDISIKEKKNAARKQGLLIEQRDDLVKSLDTLLEAISEGTAQYKIYRQFKMYNDPKLNPYLSGLIKEPAHE